MATNTRVQDIKNILTKTIPVGKWNLPVWLILVVVVGMAILVFLTKNKPSETPTSSRVITTSDPTQTPTQVPNPNPNPSPEPVPPLPPYNPPPFPRHPKPLPPLPPTRDPTLPVYPSPVPNPDTGMPDVIVGAPKMDANGIYHTALGDSFTNASLVAFSDQLIHQVLQLTSNYYENRAGFQTALVDWTRQTMGSTGSRYTALGPVNQALAQFLHGRGLVIPSWIPQIQI